MSEGEGLTEDGFLDGRLKVLQPRTGYRAATDPVLLAAAVPARAGEAVLDLGCGVGVASLCLGLRVPGLTLHGVERQADYAALARRNGARNGLVLTVWEADLSHLPRALRGTDFDQVMMNPPYFRSGDGTRARDAGREGAQREETPLARWIDAGLRRLRPGGWITVIQLADRLPDILAALGGRAGSLAILPVAPRAGRAAGRVIVRARKGGRAPAVLLAPLIIHAGDAHLRDGDDYTAAARAVLRGVEAITTFP